MDNHEHTDISVNPVVAASAPARESGAAHGQSSVRAQLEESQLPDRVRMVAAEINRKAGYHVLELLDFLPPQRSVLRVCFSKHRVDYIMEIIIRTNGPAVVFHSVYRFLDRLDRYFHKYLRTFRSRAVFKQYINPQAVTEELVQAWFSFLLSGFDKKFISALRSELPKEKHSPRVSGPFDKVSA
jgi:hypothetical protein